MAHVCKICAATKQVVEITTQPQTEEELFEHIESEHGVVVQRTGETMGQAKARFRAKYKPQPKLAYVCAACGAFAKTEATMLDSGTTLTCDECGKDTVVDLDTPEQRAKRYDA